MPQTPSAGSKGYALGGSRAEPWPYFPSLVLPGPETDMRSIEHATWRNQRRSLPDHAAPPTDAAAPSDGATRSTNC